MHDYSESLLVHFRRIEDLRQEALSLPSIDLNSRQLCDLELLLNRSYFPLNGYLDQDNYESVLGSMRLTDGTLCPMPIYLDLNCDQAAAISAGNPLAINDPEGFLLAVLSVTSIWQPDKKLEAKAVYGTDDPAKHPGVKHLFEDVGSHYIGGTLEGLHLPLHYDFQELRLTPGEIHRRLSQNGWRKIIAFQAENCLHRAQREMVMTAARDAGCNIFLQPLDGFNEPGNIEHYTRIRCYQEIVKKFPPNMISLCLTPMALRYAGPKESLWRALIAKNFGSSHFLVADDHCDPFASSGQNHDLFYPVGAARELVQAHEEETGITMVPLEKMVYVEEKAQYVPFDQVKSGMTIKDISDNELRRRLENDLEIPAWFSYPEVISELKYASPSRAKQGFTVFITGFSGAGKSTIARILMVKFMEMRHRPVTLLDGDIVRKNLSSELNFSKEHRNLNITRIGFVASEITKNGGIALCAPIAPYEESRQACRKLISKHGGFIEVFLSTPLEICEGRDRKGLYAKARAGTIKGVTGVSDPYIPPSNPELTINTGEVTPAEGAQEVLLYLEEQGYIT